MRLTRNVVAATATIALTVALAGCGDSTSSPSAGLPTITVPAPSGAAAAAAAPAPAANGEIPGEPSDADVAMPTGPATSADIVRLVTASQGIRRVPDDLRPPLVDVQADTEDILKDGCQAQDSESTVGPCVYGDPSGSKTVVLLGDSHAGMWQPALDAMAKRAGWKEIVLSKPGCPAPEMSFFDLQEKRVYPECDRWHSYTQQRVSEAKPDLVVVSSAYFHPQNSDQSPVTTQQWTAGLTKTLRQLKQSARKVAVLGDIAYGQQDPAACLAAHLRNATKCEPKAADAILADHQAAERTAAQQTGATYVDVTPWLCATYCPEVVGNIAVYRNQFHISTVWARFVSDALQKKLGVM